MGYPTLCSVLLAIGLLLAGNGVASAQNAEPDTLRERRRIPERQLAEKKEGRSLVVLPGPGYSPDLGFIVAALAGYYQNGTRENPNFAYAPYEYATTLLLSWSTRGMFSALVDWDAPYIRNSSYRIRARVWFQRNPIEPYFGIGAETLDALTTPEGRTYASFDDYQSDLLLIEDGQTDAYYNYYLSRKLLLNAEVERDLLSGRARAGVGLTLSRFWITDYTGREVPGTPRLDADDREDAPMRQTKLSGDHEAGKIQGFRGGWNNSVQVGLAYDTRDLEPNPRSGMFLDVLIAGSGKGLGSVESYAVATLAARFYYTPFAAPEVILAVRGSYSARWGQVPFFVMNYIPTTEKHIYGLGGESTLRGFWQSRFVGPVMAFSNVEARWVWARFTLRDQYLEWMFVPFADVGRVYEDMAATTLDRLKWAYGGGLRVAVNQSFVLALDLGFSQENKGLFYMSFGNIF